MLKLVKVESVRGKETLVSVYARGKAKTIYNIGEWTFPPMWLAERGYGLLGFDNEENIKQFLLGHLSVMHNSIVRVYECSTGRISFVLPPYLKETSMAVGEIVPLKGTYLADFPKGTLMTTKVRLDNLVASWEYGSYTSWK